MDISQEGPARSNEGYERGPVRGRRPRLAWLLSVVAVLVVIIGLAAIKTMQVMAAIAYGESFPEPAEAVIEAVATTRPIAPTATAIGALQAKNIVELRVERAGVIRAVNFQSGDAVEAEALLVQIDVAEEEADLKAAEVEARRARNEASRQRKLFREGTGTESRLQSAEAEAAIALARVETLKTAIDRKTIRAPFAGRVGITDLKPGQYVSEGDLVTRIVGLDPDMYVDFALPQAAALAFDERDPVTVQIGTLTVSARVSAREPAIDAGSRSLSFRAVIAGLGGRAPAGSLVTVSVPIGPPADRVVIPRTALMRTPYGDTVFVLQEVDGQTRAKAVIVQAGSVIGSDEVVIRSGLEAGARIAADGVFKLRDGALVRPVARDGAQAEARP
ncbi:MAG: efflux RND transporter periplasmic adaptor subunit [Alphaproteobacteria bacterium]